VNSSGSESEEDAGQGRAADRPALPYAKAFVVQFTAGTDVQVKRVAGRVEHLQSGRRSRFASIDELLACIVAMLGGRPSRPAKARRPGQANRSHRNRGPKIEPRAGEAPPSP